MEASRLIEKSFKRTFLGKMGLGTCRYRSMTTYNLSTRALLFLSCVLEAMDLLPDEKGTYESVDPERMAKSCRHLAAWKLAGNGNNVSRFAARGGLKGSKNPRKSFGAQLADPYAEPDEEVRPYVDAALREVCAALLDDNSPDNYKDAIVSVVPKEQIEGVCSSLAYLRDRVGVPRDLPLASARYLRAYLNWGIRYSIYS
jgi:glutathione S-transferase